MDVVSCNCSIVYCGKSGLVTPRGNINQCKVRYRVAFGAFIAFPTDGTDDGLSGADYGVRNHRPGTQQNPQTVKVKLPLHFGEGVLLP